MTPKSSREIRQGFLDYFKKHDHLIIEGSSVVPKDDPSLLFINAGMAPLKPYFLGHKTPKNKKMANVQPCIRTNDIADVGDRHHLTMFEMLGSWSIGDYYKTKAVELAYGLLVDVLGFDVNRLYASVYAGNKDLGLAPDEESYAAWEKVGIKRDRIVMLGEDNFWSAGDTGPCGPCTEVFYDTGDAFGEAYKPGSEFDTSKRYIEIWNAGVFMELNRKKDGSYEKLPFKSVDTGSGLERMSMVMNGVDTVYETDLFAPLMAHAKAAYKNLSETDYRIMADHMRASCFILSSGVICSNEGQGYIPRRLLRKCMASVYRSGESLTRLTEFYDEVVALLGEAYPELVRQKDQILFNLKQEVSEFEPVIKAGIKIFNERLEGLDSKEIKGHLAFDLVSTHGLPLEVISSLAAARGYKVDQAGYERAFKQHQDTSRVLSGAMKGSSEDRDRIRERIKGAPKTAFSGFDAISSKAKVLYVMDEKGQGDSLSKGETGYLVTDSTVFYAESGGQVGDKGEGSLEGGRFTILDTQKHDEVFLHKILVQEGQVAAGAAVSLSVAEKDRQRTTKNHSATHLLHAALRLHLGKNVTQKGSYVDAGKLRFDFQHPKAVTPSELLAVENTVNEWIFRGIKNDTQEMSMEQAIEKGAMALFNENYGDTVRVVQFGDASTELCGGCHVADTSQIGVFSIQSESSVAKGIRRIEAITEKTALHEMQKARSVLKEASELLGVKQDGIKEAIAKLKKQLKEKQKKASKGAGAGPAFTRENSSDISGRRLLVALSDQDKTQIFEAAKKAMSEGPYDVVVVATQAEKNSLFVFVEKKAAKKMTANDILKSTLGPLDGRGGGKPHFAQGGFNQSLSAEALMASLVTSVTESMEACGG